MWIRIIGSRSKRPSKNANNNFTLKYDHERKLSYEKWLVEGRCQARLTESETKNEEVGESGQRAREFVSGNSDSN